MATLRDIKAAVEDQGRAFDLYQEKQNTYLASLLDRIEELESRASSPGRTWTNTESANHTKKFLHWLRRPHDHAARAALAEAESEISRKAVTIASQPGGGYAVPEEIARDIEARAKALNPFRQLVTVRTVGTTRYHELVSMGDDAFGWVGEGGTRSETATPTLRDREPTFGTAYALPKASEESLNDIFFDVQGWLVENAGDSIAAGEAVAIVSGNGTAKPTGFLNTTPVTTTDDASPMRSAEALMYVPGLSGSPAALDADLIIDLATASLKESYLVGDGVAWVCHRTALSQIRQLKDSSGRYVWAESLVPGVPGTLLGYPVYTSDAMPTVATNNFPIAFGNWRRGYVLADVVGMRVIVDEVTTPGQIRFYIRRRVGGIIRNNDALRVVKWATT